jgi:hypothetical protein
MENEGCLPRRNSWRLCVRRDRGGKGELKSCTAPGSTGGPQAAAMGFNDRPADGQPHTGPLIFGRKECLEDFFSLLRRQSHAVVADRDKQLAVTGFRCRGLRVHRRETYSCKAS